MREIWKPVVGHEGLYEVSNLGNVRRLSTKGTSGTGNYAREGRVLRIRKNNKGYSMVDLWFDGKREQKLVHRLVAEAFIPNPENLPEVNHRDENPSNCNSDNLEWCNHLYNSRYGNRNEKIGKANSKVVLQFDTEGVFLKRYCSTMQAQRDTGIGNSRISECCNGKRKMAGGYIWRYEQ